MQRTSVLDLPQQPSVAFAPAGASDEGTAVVPGSRIARNEVYGLILVLAGYALALALSWRKWPDLLVDFGTQLYLPWQLASGSVLYRDVMYLTGGPLSQHYHALLFALFGPSLLTIVISNLLLGLGLLVLMYRCFLASSDVWTATSISLAVALVFACNQYSNIGNFNFITPYCHEIWHGLVLSIVAVALLSRWAKRSACGLPLCGVAQAGLPRRSVAKAGLGHSNVENSNASASDPRITMITGVGCCAGLVFMTKPEMFFALMLAFLTAVYVVGRAQGAKAAGKGFLCAIAGATLPLAAFLLWFHRTESWHESLRSVCYAWVPLLGSAVSQQFFYKWCLGLDAPGFHQRMLLLHLLVLGVVLAGLALAFRQKLDTSRRRLLALGFVALLLALASAVDWVDCGRSLPVLALALCLVTGRLLLRPLSAGFDGRRRAVFPFIWGVFAFALLAKLGLYSRIWHYGFALAMPAFAAAVFLLLWTLPLTLEKFGVNRNLFRGALTLLLATGCLRLFVQSQQIFHPRTLPVGSGRDTVFTQGSRLNPAGAAVQEALSWMSKNTAKDASLAVLPEGVMINYLSRRVNPTRYLVWNPAEIASFGQENMVAAFCSHPPDYVMLVHRDGSEYGADFFGRQKSFGGELLEWINANYEPVHLIGNEPLRDQHFGIRILKHATRLTSQPLL